MAKLVLSAIVHWDHLNLRWSKGVVPNEVAPMDDGGQGSFHLPQGWIIIAFRP